MNSRKQQMLFYNQKEMKGMLQGVEEYMESVHLGGHIEPIKGYAHPDM